MESDQRFRKTGFKAGRKAAQCLEEQKWNSMSPHGGSAVALGLFDGVHLGHRAVLAMTAACAIAQQLTPCAFTFAADSIPAKQGVPLAFLYTDAQKRRLMQACGIAHVYCPTFSALRHLDGEAFCRHVLVEMLHAREVFCGDDFRFKL